MQNTENTPQIIPTETPPTPETTLTPYDLPYRQAALALTSAHPLATTVELDAMTAALEASADCGAGELEPLMALQARVLDTLFSRSVQLATADAQYHKDVVDLALRTQRQCRATVESLRLLQKDVLEEKRRGWIRAEQKLARDERRDEKWRAGAAARADGKNPENEKKDGMNAFEFND